MLLETRHWRQPLEINQIPFHQNHSTNFLTNTDSFIRMPFSNSGISHYQILQLWNCCILSLLPFCWDQWFLEATFNYWIYCTTCHAWIYLTLESNPFFQIFLKEVFKPGCWISLPVTTEVIWTHELNELLTLHFWQCTVRQNAETLYKQTPNKI